MNSKLQSSIKRYKRIATLMIILFAVAFVIDAFKLIDFNVAQFKSLFVIIYLYSSLKYHQLSLKEKNDIIASLEQKLKKIEH